MLDSESAADTVRFAAPDDEDDVLESVRLMQADAEWALCDRAGVPLPFCEAKARTQIARALRVNNDPDILPSWIGVIGAPGRVEASIYVATTEPWCSDVRHLVEVWAYVVPECRRAPHAHMLVAFGKSLAVATGLQLYSATQAGAKHRFYEREYGTPIGSLFRYDSAPAGF